ncbi:NAD-dependent succinate-semialdehyde dehydrogenase [Paraburkholderia unamae]|uniref:Succinate-semialdehyde dehydrogenase/glutarate-semialdehyde dehydrogenase n=1 Tax=Paraburkholderia unamae TaxID=219649 RepID=A0ABX5K7B8_9BURK|nr:NAD-dependent succinate-semialdehyde dehydrogenase [Paraburkholderia unamae]PVX61343.1 succinate-semialdehyde dehydrogenase/glutarate-semialdehyde dehydrogenase [Paraburkholderia unamae]CAG9269955.1 Alpha-ketoglutaric semialdehyde dehydrogenase 1 [Paraburkholderia unamae]
MTLDAQQPHMFIGGAWTAGEGHPLVLRDPATAQPFAEYRGASSAQVAQALDRADAAFPRWAATPARERRALLRDAAARLVERMTPLAAQLTREQGKPLAEAVGEWQAAVDTLIWYADEAVRAYGRLVPARQDGVQQGVQHEPIGPVAAFAPWNFPALTPMRKIGAALAAGCTCIIKPAEETPLSTLAIAQALREAGLPDGVLNVVYGDAPAIAAALIESPLIRKISFTGSTPVGKALAARAGAHAKPLTLELGGHAPVVVFDDADLDLVVRQAGAGKFRNAGQICVAPTRFIVHEAVHDAFVAKLGAYAQALQTGAGAHAGTQMGPLANARRVAHMAALVEDARAGGAVVTTGRTHDGPGFFWPATVLHNLAPDARILHDEPFGPLAPCVRFGHFDEAMRIANGVPFGLAAYCFTRSLDTAHRAGNTLHAGMVGVNTTRVSLPELPFGGVGESGYGREGGVEGLEPYRVTKSVSLAWGAA